LSTLEQFEQAERAYTAIVEALPTESESHKALAEIRQSQGRWDNAIVHWRQVARIRELEPTGLLKLAAAQIHQKQWDAADATTDKLRSRSWPSRFSNVESQTRDLENQIERGRSK
jgi:tetratricopeptide (TPR) repeat protein